MINYDNLSFLKIQYVLFYIIFIYISVLQFVVILESVLAKLSRYDEGTLFSSFLSFTVRKMSGLIYLKKHYKVFSLKIHFQFILKLKI